MTILKISIHAPVAVIFCFTEWRESLKTKTRKQTRNAALYDVFIEMTLSSMDQENSHAKTSSDKCCLFNSKHMYHIFFSKTLNGIYDFTDTFIFYCIYIYMYVTVFFTHMSYNM